jgi:hemerythrin
MPEHIYYMIVAGLISILSALLVFLFSYFQSKKDAERQFRINLADEYVSKHEKFLKTVEITVSRLIWKIEEKNNSQNDIDSVSVQLKILLTKFLIVKHYANDDLCKEYINLESAIIALLDNQDSDLYSAISAIQEKVGQCYKVLYNYKCSFLDL